MNDKNLRKDLTSALKGRNAHVDLEKALDDLNPDLRNLRPSQNLHTIWQELEHLRITQEDLLQYMINPDWKSPKWPNEYWPQNFEVITDDMWDESVQKFHSDLSSIIALVNNPEIDITSQIPHASKHTYLREILLVIDHNAYHIGQIVETRKLLANW